MTVDRDVLRDTVNYLRQVRPIDPEEIREYFEARPSAAEVRAALREEAYALSLVEREDGTFEPVAEAPPSPPDWQPDGLPERYERALSELLVDRFGEDWHRGESGDELRAAVRRLKADYYHGNPVAYDETAALGYAVYHLPDYYAAMGYVLDDLAETGRLPRKLRVVDVGAGVGGPALALHDYLRDACGDDPPLVDYHALEPSPAASVLTRLLAETGPNFRTVVHDSRAEAFDPAGLGELDLVTFCNVLSELDDPTAVGRRYLDALADDGTWLAMAPADLNTSTGLREVEPALAPPESDVSVYSPTLRLWPDEAPDDRGWSFDVRPALEAPDLQRDLDRGRRRAADADGGGDADRPGGDEAGDGGGAEAEPKGTFRKTAVQFSYALLRPDGARRVSVMANPDRHAKLAETERHVSKRIDLLAVKLSPDLARQGPTAAGDRDDPNPVFKVSDGSETVEHYAVATRVTTLNRALVEAPYGAVLRFENVLALWNDDERAYNLVVDDETVVDLVAG